MAKSERYKSGYWVIKMFVWRFEEYSKLVFLDGDIYFRQSADELFCAPVSAEVRSSTQPAHNFPPPNPSLRIQLRPRTRLALFWPAPPLLPVHLPSARIPPDGP